ncbi:MAG TPA: chorismate mutase family protein [Thermomonospora sp.]|nr:chorismate mutase family protein [Thermomonospora sp.]
MTDKDDVLAPLRARLDRIDERLLDTLRERIECCVEIAHRKQAHTIAMMQPHRVEAVHRRAAAYGERHGVDPEFLRALYDLIIGETCRVEDEVMGTGGR